MTRNQAKRKNNNSNLQSTPEGFEYVVEASTGRVNCEKKINGVQKEREGEREGTKTKKEKERNGILTLAVKLLPWAKFRRR